MTDEQYPEHDKLRALDGKNETVGDFLTWLQNSGMLICRWHEAQAEFVRCEHCEGTGKEPRPPGVKRIYDCRECSVTRPGYVLISEPSGFAPVRDSIPNLLAQFFDIDEEKLDEEKRQMLTSIRAANATKEASS